MVSKTKFILLFFWAISISFVLSLLLSFHFVPHRKETLQGLEIGQLGEMRVHHFLSLQCKCSRNIVGHLLQRKSKPNIKEIVHLIHGQSQTVFDLSQAGFQVQSLDEESAVKQFNLQSLPQFIVMSGPETLYQGGYGRDQQHSQVYEDENIIERLSRHQPIREFPIFGCANGKMRKQLLDRLGMKYKFYD